MDLQQYIKEIQEELSSILQYWMCYTVDEQQGGFYGKVDNDNSFYTDAPKGSVLNARILWTFSAAYNDSNEPRYLEMADRAFQYIVDHFVDNKYGGVFWSVDSAGRPLDTKKQIYALAFVIYGCSEYYKCNRSEQVKLLAIHIYELIQQYSYDKEKGGYLEAFGRDWHELTEMRLSAKDANEKKTMNTHLHVLEAYTSLYKIWPDRELANHISLLLYNFDDHIVNKDTWHLNLFFDEDWKVKPDVISYGHDIEASWLLPEAAEALDNEELVEKMRRISIKTADATIEGLDSDGGLWYEYEPAHRQLIKQKHWWPQAEAQVGFFNAWQVSGNDKYLKVVFDNWAFIKKHIRDSLNGEWFWGVDENHVVMPGEDKAGLWKCPYHNSRAFLEIVKRIQVETH
jgi:cellobiose epimerase